MIDEIQLMADEDRGWAWTRAFFGALLLGTQGLFVCPAETHCATSVNYIAQIIAVHIFRLICPDFAGIPAKELHLCGDVSCLPLVSASQQLHKIITIAAVNESVHPHASAGSIDTCRHNFIVQRLRRTIR